MLCSIPGPPRKKGGARCAGGNDDGDRGVLHLLAAGAAVALNDTCTKFTCPGTEDDDQTTATTASRYLCSSPVTTRWQKSDKGKVFGGPGNDQIRGGEGDDVLNGEEGRDNIVDSDRSGSDSDKILGGPGNDTINVADGVDDDTVDCGGDRDTVKFDPGDDINDNCEVKKELTDAVDSTTE